MRQRRALRDGPSERRGGLAFIGRQAVALQDDVSVVVLLVAVALGDAAAVGNDTDVAKGLEKE